MTTQPCRCIKCYNAALLYSPPSDDEHFTISATFVRFRYACEICGNKRCPHHSDHELPCTNSNEPGQPGSIFK